MYTCSYDGSLGNHNPLSTPMNEATRTIHDNRSTLYGGVK